MAKKSKKKLRPLGTILLELEPLLEELVDEQDCQWSDVISLVHYWLMVHRPEAQETYLDGTHPILSYGLEGPEDSIKSYKKDAVCTTWDEPKNKSGAR